MPRYRIHRMKEAARENFRWAPHTAGLATVKTKDYEAGEEVEANNPYEIWKQMLQQGRALHPGDLVETFQPEADCQDAVDLKIVKYIGFEPAQWYVAEPKPGPITPEVLRSTDESLSNRSS